MKRILSFFLIMAMVLTLWQSYTFAQEDICTIYVSTDGNDSNEGTFLSPLATFSAARDKIRELKNSGLEYSRGYVVNIRGGTYNMTESFELSSEDSGLEEAPIVYQAYDGEEVKVIGGIDIPSNYLSKVTDTEILNRIIEGSARDDIYCVQLSLLDIYDVGDDFFPGAYSYFDAALEAGLISKPNEMPMELFVNGAPMKLARYPNKGYCYIDTVVDKGYTGGSSSSISSNFEFAIADERIKKWIPSLSRGVLMYGYWRYDWADATVPIDYIDEDNLHIKSAVPSAFGVRNDAPFYVFNLIEELDSPGEYYIDKSSNILYLFPPSNMNDSNIVLSTLTAPMVNLVDVSNVRFNNIHFGCTRGSAISIRGGENNLIRGGSICNTAKMAVSISGINNGISDCHIFEVNGGISLSGGDLETVSEGQCYATNNHIERFSRISQTYTPAIKLGGVGNIATHNEIHDSPHEAVTFWGVKHKIMYNDIYNVVNSTDDAGAIYGGLDWVGRCHEIKYNYIHDIVNSIDGGSGVAAIYLDGGQCEIFVTDNVFANIDGYAVKIGGGRDNVVENNIFADCITAFYANDCMLTEVYPAGSLQTVHYPSLQTAPVYSKIWQKEFPKLYAMLQLPDEKKCLPEGNIYQNNLVFRSGLADLVGVAKEYIDVSGNYQTDDDPGFYNLDNGDYTIVDNSEIVSNLPNFISVPFGDMSRTEGKAVQILQNTIVMKLDNNYCLVHGKNTKQDTDQYVRPRKIEGVIYVPLRFLAEMFDADVDYNPDTGDVSVYQNGTALHISENVTILRKAGLYRNLKHEPILLHDRIMISIEDAEDLFSKTIEEYEDGLIFISEKGLFQSGENIKSELIRFINKKILLN